MVCDKNSHPSIRLCCDLCIRFSCIKWLDKKHYKSWNGVSLSLKNYRLDWSANRKKMTEEIETGYVLLFLFQFHLAVQFFSLFHCLNRSSDQIDYEIFAPRNAKVIAMQLHVFREYKWFSPCRRMHFSMENGCRFFFRSNAMTRIKSTE